MRSPAYAILGLVLAGGCTSKTPASGPGIDAAPGGDYALTCESGSAQFPPLDKQCTVPGDCAIVQHMISCCGTMIAIGLAQTSVAAFDTAEAQCAAGYPGCGCASEPTAAEDGRTTVDGTIAVTCTMGACTTYVP